MDRLTKGQKDLADQLEESRKPVHTFMGFPIVHLGDDRPRTEPELLGSPLGPITDGPFGPLDDEEAGVVEQVPDPPVEDEVEDCVTCDGMGYCQECDGGGECSMCDGAGEEDGVECMDCGTGGWCGTCDGSGDCSDCDGIGTIPKGGK